MRIARWNGQTGYVVQENHGRWLIDFNGRKQWVLKGIPDLEIIDRHAGGRPRKFASDAEKQRAYRERKAGKALRNYQRRHEK